MELFLSCKVITFGSLGILLVFLNYTVPTEATGVIEVVPNGVCQLGTVTEQSPCRTCVCGLFGYEYCANRLCLQTTTTRKPSSGSGSLVPGPTNYPILIPSPSRRRQPR